MRVGIVGAGIGGLALALLLRRQGAMPVIFEKFEKPRPVGSGLVIQPVGQAVLSRCGVLRQVIAAGRPIFDMKGDAAKRSGGARLVLDVTYGPRGGSDFGLGLQRACLFGALWDAAQAAGIETRCGIDVKTREGTMLIDANGTRHGDFDLIVDSSGANSALSPLTSKILSYGALWGNVDWPEGTDLAKDGLRQRYRAASRMAGVLPTGAGREGKREKAAIFWSLPRRAIDAWRAAGLAAWQREMSALWPEMIPFAAQITDQSQLTAAIYSHGTLHRPYDQGIVFIGDAAHRASPQLGQGANMALLDAAALTQALEEYGPQGAGAAYAQARRFHVRTYQTMSALFTPLYQSDSRVLPRLRDQVLFPLSKLPPVPGVLSRLVQGRLVRTGVKGI